MLLGKVRAKQYYSDDHARARNMGILLHGDGSFSGQARSPCAVSAAVRPAAAPPPEGRWCLCWRCWLNEAQTIAWLRCRRRACHSGLHLSVSDSAQQSALAAVNAQMSLLVW